MTYLLPTGFVRDSGGPGLFDAQNRGIEGATGLSSSRIQEIRVWLSQRATGAEATRRRNFKLEHVMFTVALRTTFRTFWLVRFAGQMGGVFV